MVSLAQGDLPGARAVIRAANDVEPARLIVYFANYWEQYWVLDQEQQDILLRLTPGSFDDSRSA
jgi:hypothetical protein